MALISPADQQHLRESFAEMKRPVRLLFFTQTLDCETCVQTRLILDELPPLSDKIAIEEVNFVLDGDRVEGVRHRSHPGSRHRVRRRRARGGSRRRQRLPDQICGDAGWLRVHLARSGDPARRRPRVDPVGRQPRACGERHATGQDTGILNAELTALSAGREPRARNGFREPQHHGVRRGGH